MFTEGNRIGNVIIKKAYDSPSKILDFIDFYSEDWLSEIKVEYYITLIVKRINNTVLIIKNIKSLNDDLIKENCTVSNEVYVYIGKKYEYEQEEYNQPYVINSENTLINTKQYNNKGVVYKDCVVFFSTDHIIHKVPLSNKSCKHSLIKLLMNNDISLQKKVDSFLTKNKVFFTKNGKYFFIDSKFIKKSTIVKKINNLFVDFTKDHTLSFTNESSILDNNENVNETINITTNKTKTLNKTSKQYVISKKDEELFSPTIENYEVKYIEIKENEDASINNQRRLTYTGPPIPNYNSHYDDDDDDDLGLNRNYNNLLQIRSNVQQQKVLNLEVIPLQYFLVNNEFLYNTVYVKCIKSYYTIKSGDIFQIAKINPASKIVTLEELLTNAVIKKEVTFNEIIANFDILPTPDYERLWQDIFSLENYIEKIPHVAVNKINLSKTMTKKIINYIQVKKIDFSKDYDFYSKNVCNKFTNKRGGNRKQLLLNAVIIYVKTLSHFIPEIKKVVDEQTFSTETT